MLTRWLRNGTIWVLALVLVLLGSVGILAAQEDEPLYMDPDQPISQRVEDLLSRMTLEEKVGQMAQVDLRRLMGNGQWDRGKLNEKWLENILVENNAGSLLSGGGAAPVPGDPKSWAETTNAVQKYAVENTRLHIPIVYGVDAVHGHNNVLGATIFPHNIGLGATWDIDLLKKLGAATAEDVRATGVHWNFSPVADLSRDLRWGRFYETLSEDPYLAGQLNAANIKGMQGDDLASDESVAATSKHYLGYPAPENGNDREPADISMRTLRELFYPPFIDAIESGAATVMANSGSVNGIPVHASHYLLTDVLRDKMGFEGPVVSDWADISKLVHTYHIARDRKDAIRIAINAGVDMSMIPHDADGFTSRLIELVNEGQVSMDRINEAARRILTLKFKLGLFEDPYVDPAEADDVIIGAHRDLALRAARESMTLLKNENVLPLSKDIGSILVTGPSANSMANLMGGWTIDWQGPSNEDQMPPAVTILQGIKDAVSDQTTVNFVRGVPEGDKAEDPAALEEAISAAVDAAQNADAIVMVVGEKPYAEGPGDTNDGELPAAQTRLIKAMADTGKDVVLVLVAGRPMMMTDSINAVSGFLMAWLPGTEGGSAVADVLFGDYNPSGRLSVSWPKEIGQIPIHYNDLRTTSYKPLYPFGYGLSYTTYKYENLTLANDTIAKDGTLHVTVDVSNTGDMAGDEIVAMFASPKTSSVLTPRKELVAFKRVSLKPGETKTVSLSLHASQLSIIPGDIIGTADRVVESGTYTVAVDELSKTFTIK